MEYHSTILRVCFFLASTHLISGCVSAHEPQKKVTKSKNSLQVKLNQYKQSDFKQVEATLSSKQSKELVFRVLSDVGQTAQWLERMNSVEVLAAYNNNQYLLRTVINSPWPFKNRELITCVNTFFEENMTTINIYSCSDRVPLNNLYVRVLEVESSWTIKKVSNSLVEINYKTWIDPTGYVPAFIFNGELIDSTEADLKKLQVIIDNASLDEYSY